MFDLRAIAVVGIGAALGGILRLLITQFVIARFGMSSVQFATMFINVSGSFLIGIVIEMSQARTDWSPLVRYFLATGILGGYTTFSTFSFEALALAGSSGWGAATLYAVGSVVLGILAAVAGVTTARTFVH
jgi:CrcB protein